jgi:hypothetical protein
MEQQKFLELYNLQYTDSRIAKEMGMTVPEIEKFRKSLKLPHRITQLSDLDREKAINLYNNGFSVAEIARIFFCSEPYIKRGIIGENRKSRRLVTENVFSDLSREDVQYWLGWLASDGCVHKNRISLSLAEKDRDVLEKFRDFLGNPKINIRETIHHKKFKQLSISFRNAEIAEFLKSLGITENKTFTLETLFPLSFPYMRGYIEGDGYIDPKQDRICLVSASLVHIEQISAFLTKNLIEFSRHTKIQGEKNIHYLEINKQSSVLNLICLLYFNACTFMNRKYNNACQIRNSLMKLRQIQGTSVGNPEPTLDTKE